MVGFHAFAFDRGSTAVNCLHTYAAVSILIGLLQVLGGVNLIKYKCKLIVLPLAVVEIFWMFVSSSIVRVFEANDVSPFAPYSFVVYVILSLVGGCAGTYASKRVGNPLTIENFPFAASIVGVLFGLYFMMAATFILRMDAY